jgi:hypothetical protein
MTSSPLVKLLGSLRTARASFVEPMECLPVTQLPDGVPWVYESKLDAIGVRNEHGVLLFSKEIPLTASLRRSQ